MCCDVSGVVQVLNAELDGLRRLRNRQARARDKELVVAVGRAVARVEGYGRVQGGDHLGHDARLHKGILEVERAYADGVVVGKRRRRQRQGD